MKKVIGFGVAAIAAVIISAAPASAHILVVSPPGGDEKVVYPIGGGALPGKGQGLVPGGPPWDRYLQSPAHAKGLNQACESLRASGQTVVDLFGPPTPAGCTHGT